MKLVPTRRTDYAIQAMVFLARQPGDRIPAAAIADGMELDLGYLHQVLGNLQRAGLVSARTGRSGGYELGRAANEITVLDIVESMEGSVDGGECALQGGPCHWDRVCALHWVWSAAKEAFAERLSGASLAEVAATDAALAAETIDIPTASHRR